MPKTISPKQLIANRANALKAGVKTSAGKEISKYNAMKHGILCQQTIIENEDKEQFEALRSSMIESLKPEKGLELVLVEKMVVETWRLKRAFRVESEMIAHDVEDDFLKSNNPMRRMGQSFHSDFMNHDTYLKLTRYLGNIERSMFRTLHELQRLQALRRGQQVQLPVAFDINIDQKDEMDSFSKNI